MTSHAHCRRQVGGDGARFSVAAGLRPCGPAADRQAIDIAEPRRHAKSQQQDQQEGGRVPSHTSSRQPISAPTTDGGHEFRQHAKAEAHRLPEALAGRGPPRPCARPPCGRLRAGPEGRPSIWRAAPSSSLGLPDYSPKPVSRAMALPSPSAAPFEQTPRIAKADRGPDMRNGDRDAKPSRPS